MNIFYVDECPYKASQCLVDDHVRKMIIESAQMLANAYSYYQLKYAPLTQENTTREYSYRGHPCSVWTLKSIDNFNWLLNHAIGISQEYYYRFDECHFTNTFINWVDKNPPNLPSKGFLPPAMAIPLRCKISEDRVECYRYYYQNYKTHLFQWTRRDPPTWLKRKE